MTTSHMRPTTEYCHVYNNHFFCIFHANKKRPHRFSKCMTCLKPGSLMPPTCTLRFCRRIALQISAYEVHMKYLHRRQSPACLRSWTQLNFAGKPAVNAWDRLCAGYKCSHMPQRCPRPCRRLSQAWFTYAANLPNSRCKLKLPNFLFTI